jgi:Tol biopolymer transport system component
MARRIVDAGAKILGLTWSEDGNSLIYSANISSNDFQLWRIGLEKGAKPRKLETATRMASFPAAARHGNRLAYAGDNSDQDIWRVRREESARSFLASSLLDNSPQFSPDGRRIAFASGRGADRVAIWCCNSDGEDCAPLTNASSYDGSPRWSPDGQWIAFDSIGKENRRNVLLVKSSGGPSHVLVASPSATSVLPSWSHDGKWVYFGSDRGGRFEIWRVPSGGGTPEQVTNAGGYMALVSPDGKMLFYTKTGSFSGPVFQRPIDGGDETRVLDSVDGRSFATANDGIYHVTCREHDRCEIKFRDLRAGGERKVADFGSQVRAALGLAVSPDQSTFLFTMWASKSTDIMIVENFR